MEKFKQLLDLKDSELAKVLRVYLIGIKASLQQTQKEYPSDSGVSICTTLLEELDILLDGYNDNEPTTLFSEEKRENKFKLNSLQDEFFTDNRLFAYFGDQIQSQSKTDEQLWNEIHHLLLRVPENLAQSWQNRALGIASQIGVKESKNQKYFVKLPLDCDEIIYPALTNGIRGLCFSEQEQFDHRVNPIQKTNELYLLGCIVSSYLTLIELKPSLQLYHTFETVRNTGLWFLEDEAEASKYIDALVKSFERCLKAEQKQDVIESLKTRLHLDEAIHSLVFSTPAHPDSWWRKLQQRSRRSLNPLVESAREKGHKITMRYIKGIYGDVRKLSKNNIEIDSGGTPGEVVTCLRVYARIDEEEYLGRVLYRSLR